MIVLKEPTEHSDLQCWYQAVNLNNKMKVGGGGGGGGEREREENVKESAY